MSVETNIKSIIKKSMMRQLREERSKRKMVLRKVAEAINMQPGSLDMAEMEGRITWKMLKKLLNYYKKSVSVSIIDRQ